MPNFHLYFMASGAPVGSQSIEAVDEAEAIRIARGSSEAEAIEIWDDCRRLGVLGQRTRIFPRWTEAPENPLRHDAVISEPA